MFLRTLAPSSFSICYHVLGCHDTCTLGLNAAMIEMRELYGDAGPHIIRRSDALSWSEWLWLLHINHGPQIMSFIMGQAINPLTLAVYMLLSPP